MAKVPKYEEASSLHLAGLAGTSGGGRGARLGHRASSTRSEDLGRVGRFVLRCLGRRVNTAPSPASDTKPDATA